jgi:hypothetical protein
MHLFHVLVTLPSGHRQIGQFFFLIVRLLNFYRQTINPLWVGHRCGNYRLIATLASIDIIISVLGSVNLFTVRMVSQRPVHTDYRSASTSIVGCDRLPMTSHQVISTPPRFKHRFMHGTTTHLLVTRPDDLGVDPLQSLVSTQEQSIDIAADMLKSVVSAEYLSVGGEKSLESRDNSY